MHCDTVFGIQSTDNSTRHFQFQVFVRNNAKLGKMVCLSLQVLEREEQLIPTKVKGRKEIIVRIMKINLNNQKGKLRRPKMTFQKKLKLIQHKNEIVQGTKEKILQWV